MAQVMSLKDIEDMFKSTKCTPVTNLEPIPCEETHGPPHYFNDAGERVAKEMSTHKRFLLGFEPDKTWFGLKIKSSYKP